MKLGYSNKFFYYTATGKGTFDQRYTIQFKEDLNLDAIRIAINKAVDNYPEYKQRIIINGNKFDAEENDKYPVLFTTEGNHKYGSDEVNNYTYFFTYNSMTNKLVTNIFHGVADALSIIVFHTCILYYYALELGDSFSEEELLQIKNIIRTSKDDYKNLDELEMFNPFLKYVDMNAKPEYKFVCNDAFYYMHEQYNDEAEYIHSYDLTIDVPSFVKKTKEIGTTFAPLLIYSISSMMSWTYDIKDKPIVAMLPLDNRRILGINTMVNCAEGLFIPFYKEDRDKDIKEVCDNLKEYIVKQQTKEYIQEIMANKINRVNEYENSQNTIYQITRENQKYLPKEAKRPTSYAMSYSGKVSFTSALDKYIDNYSISAYVRSYSCIACSFGDKLNIKIGLRTDDITFPMCIKQAFERIGLEAKLVDNGRLYANILDIDILKKV